MALNSSHAGKGVLLYAGEAIILFCDHVGMEFDGNIPAVMKGPKNGRLYLTTHRMIFNNKSDKDSLQSFATPFFCLKNVELEQPIFGANYIKGHVTGQQNGGFQGEVKFKLTFKNGGAIEYGQAMLKVAQMATRNVNPMWRDAPPPYTPPQGPWSQAPPPAYDASPAGYYGWAPPTQTFPDRPPTDGVFMYDAPPPYPGLSPQGAYSQPGGYPSQPAPPQGFAAQPTYPPQPNYGAPPAYPTQPNYGAPPAYPTQPNYGAPPMNPPPYSSQPGYAPANGFVQTNPTPMPGFAPPQNASTQNAYYDPNNPQFAYVPPPAYAPTAPSYDETSKKMN